MPIYEYQCASCGHAFEQFIIGDEKSESRTCPKCGKAEATKVFSSFSAGCGGNESGGCGGGKLGFS